MDIHSLVSKVKELERELGKTPTRDELIQSGVSDWSLRKIKFTEVLKAAGLESERNKKFLPERPKILFFDIETAAILAHVWGLYDQNIGLNQIRQDWYVLSYAAKWAGEPNIHYLDQRYARPITDDKMLLEGIWHLLDMADIVVSHNGDRFDIKKLNARFIKHGMKKPSSFQSIDTLKIAKKHFAFTSNKLAHLAKFLDCDQQKSEHGKFSGMELWNETMAGNPEAFQEMEHYNKQDVLTLEAVYTKLIPWESSIHFSSFAKDWLCSCGSRSFYKNGYRTNKSGKFARMRCDNCGKEFLGKENIIPATIRKGLPK